MYIGEIGSYFNSTQKIDLVSDKTLIEYDAIIIDLDFLLIQLRQDLNFYLHRKKAFVEFLAHKKIPLILFTTKPRLVTIQNSFDINFDFFVPIPKFKLENESGQVVDVIQKTIFTEFLNKYKAYFYYDSFFMESNGCVIAVTPHTKKVLGFYNESSVFLPKLKTNIKGVENDFLKDLISNSKRVSNEKIKSSIPEWTKEFFLPKEEQLILEIEETKKSLEELNQRLEDKHNALEIFINKKVLFTGTGNELEEEVESIFKALGFEILESERNRDDLIVKHNNRIAVVEIKEVNNSAAEKHAAQLEKWVANYFKVNETKPKGILLVNSFRDIQLNGRTEKSFPDQMLKFSVQREHCLITSLQFLLLYYEVINNPSRKEELINSLFDTVGVYNGFEDWRQYISIKD